MVLLQNPNNSKCLLAVFLSPSFSAPADFSEMNNDADLISIAVWQQMIGFSIMANLFYLDGGPYSYLDFKMWSLSNFQ